MEKIGMEDLFLFPSKKEEKVFDYVLYLLGENLPVFFRVDCRFVLKEIFREFVAFGIVGHFMCAPLEDLQRSWFLGQFLLGYFLLHVRNFFLRGVLRC